VACGAHIPLIETMVKHGADPNTATGAAALHGGCEALQALLRLGARMTLAAAVALGDMEAFRKLLPSADGRERHLAMALASQYGRAEMMRILLDGGEDPNRYNPPGGHSHGTPLHHAAGGGHEEMVRLLVERGARLDLKDVLWNATPAEWARHEGKTEIEKYLREKEEEMRKKS
jgi:Ankyrin repeats (3 copies)